MMSTQPNGSSEKKPEASNLLNESLAESTMPSQGASSLMYAMTPMEPVKSRLEPTLQNIVATVNLGVRIDLRYIALQCRNSEYNPRRQNSLVMRIREPRTTALMFASGKMVCTGAKTEMESRVSARKFARIIQKLNYDAKFLNFTIHNIVASFDFEHQIYLEGMSLAFPKFCIYETEIFPGLVFRMIDPKIVLLIFVSGKIVLTGAKRREQIFEGFQKILPVIKMFAKPKSTDGSNSLTDKKSIPDSV